MAPHLRDRLPELVVFISGSSPNRFGTGFVIYIEADHVYIATCRHVVDDVGGSESILVDGQPAEVIASDSSDGSDLAVLKALRLSASSALPLCAHAQHRDSSFVTAGYRNSDGARTARSLSGRIGSRQSGITPQTGGRYPLWAIELNEGDNLARGYSGAPIVDVDGQVVGVIRIREDSGRVGLAVGIEALLSIWQEMPDEIRQSLVHSSDFHDLVSDTDLLMNCGDELSRFDRIAGGAEQGTRVIAVYGRSMSGKTRLTEEFQRLAERHGRATIRFNFKQEQSLAIEMLLDQLVMCLDPSLFAGFDEIRTAGRPESLGLLLDWHANMTRRFFTNLKAWKGKAPIFVFLDHFERADRQLRDWLTETFIPHLKWSPLVLVVAGQDRIAEPNRWNGLWLLELSGVSLEDYIKYASHRDVNLSDDVLQQLHRMVNGRPGEFVQYIEGERLV